MIKLEGFVILTEEEWNEFNRGWWSRYFELAKEFIQTDIELMRLKAEDQDRPPTTLNGPIVPEVNH